ncbi:MAG: threonine synthase [Elusimicrobiota bacterium]
MKGLIERYRRRLPVGPRTPIVTLHEGGTPLVSAPRLARLCGLPEGAVHLKLEGMNPTGSFKDRGMTLAVSKALEERARGLLCASTGNTAASAAAYAARAGLPCAVLLPAGAVAAGKLVQALMHGARVLTVRGNFDSALTLAREAAREAGWTLVNSLNPYRIQGQKTAAFEVAEGLGRAPDLQFMPVGNAGNITAYWLGYTELGGRRPRMMGWQAAGAAPLVHGRPVERPKTVATAIRIGRPASWEGALRARDESDGMIGAVSDREILSAWRFLAEHEGVFCEPSSAAGAAGLLRFARAGGFRRMSAARRARLRAPSAGHSAEGTMRAEKDLRIAVILTGHGLKDPETPLTLRIRTRTVEPRLSAVLKALKEAA